MNEAGNKNDNCAEAVPCANTDRELWREVEDDYYAPSIHVTREGLIGINVGGMVYVKTLRSWHEMATKFQAVVDTLRIEQAADAFVKRQDIPTINQADATNTAGPHPLAVKLGLGEKT